MKGRNKQLQNESRLPNKTQEEEGLGDAVTLTPLKAKQEESHLPLRQCFNLVINIIRDFHHPSEPHRKPKPQARVYKKGHLGI
uniref:Uncharacterized protein n=1 Tax=Chelonoidis abingdonii TaxID=106734 RepID=A0A8C0J8H7_CHEAB